VPHPKEQPRKLGESLTLYWKPFLFLDFEGNCRRPKGQRGGEETEKSKTRSGSTPGSLNVVVFILRQSVFNIKTKTTRRST
jgi:hypothetical protein